MVFEYNSVNRRSIYLIFGTFIKLLRWASPRNLEPPRSCQAPTADASILVFHLPVCQLTVVSSRRLTRYNRGRQPLISITSCIQSTSATRHTFPKTPIAKRMYPLRRSKRNTSRISRPWRKCWRWPRRSSPNTNRFGSRSTSQLRRRSRTVWRCAIIRGKFKTWRVLFAI